LFGRPNVSEKEKEKEKAGKLSIRLTREVQPWSHCCSGKAISITYHECVFVASGILNAMRMRDKIICGMSGSAIFFSHYLIKGMVFGGEKNQLLNTKCVI